MMYPTGRLFLSASAVVAIAISGSSSAQRPPVQAQSPAPTSHQQLELEFEDIQTESRELGGSPAPRVAINNVGTRIIKLTDQIERLEETARQLGASAKDLEEFSEEVGNATTPRDAGDDRAKRAVERGLRRACGTTARRALGWISLAGDVVEIGGELIIRELNENAIRELVRQERLKLRDLRDLLDLLRCQRAGERAKLKRLRELHQREEAIFPHIARAGMTSRGARANADLERETDAAGDAEELRRRNENGVSLADPSTAPQDGRNIVEPARPRQGVERSHSSAALPPFARDMLAVHNAERSRFGYQPLRWNPALAANAQVYARQLARTGQLAHAPREGRGIERENLSKGLVGWNADQLMASWIAERRLFRPGVFPNVSTTGNWYDVGHYSQMIWPETTDIGCAMATGSGFSWLVCRYSPGGNKDGKPVG